MKQKKNKKKNTTIVLNHKQKTTENNDDNLVQLFKLFLQTSSKFQIFYVISI